MTDTQNTNPQPSIDELINTATQLKFIGERLLQTSCEGFESGQMWSAIQFVQNLFQKVDADILAHPSYEARKAAQSEQK